MLIDEHLNWEDEIQTLTKKLARACGIICKLRHFVDYHTLISIYYAIFESHINYRIQSWGFIKRSLIDRISVLQRKTLRYIYFKSSIEHCAPLFVQSKILPIEKQLILRNCLLALDIIQQKCPDKFKTFVELQGLNHTHNTRSTKLANFLYKNNHIWYIQHQKHNS